MKLIFATLVSLILCACAQSTNTQAKAEKNNNSPRAISGHQTHFPHTHTHGKNCGHETATVGFDTVYIHDGHKHKVHSGHIDDIQ